MFEQIELPYSLDALEPYIDQLTMETHYGKHHAAYTKMFNELSDKAGLSALSAEKILATLDEVADESLRRGLRNQGGGYYNHNLYFEQLSPKPSKEVGTGLLTAINNAYGSIDALIDEMTGAATGVFGSGWVFLSVDSQGAIYISSSANQDNPISEGTGRVPILALDVWEHAYYLKYRNLRADYIKAFWEALDWSVVNNRYDEAVK